jgi:hypothetical protein
VFHDFDHLGDTYREREQIRCGLVPRIPALPERERRTLLLQLAERRRDGFLAEAEVVWG